eukprot:CAMPEP_0182433968 /NCGR_PEP_ID=MMETSP1167-20130531/66734_1 /TAXON_ID=2988 /ORGANISM="Mallomonas Sp, Strain CCMP3275" /LENGTH=57 /DNA_ID=CAMNT_0024623291 /DNA_START=520 /DNA_END=693 /DNA_ORIENTATION=+
MVVPVIMADQSPDRYRATPRDPGSSLSEEKGRGEELCYVVTLLDSSGTDYRTVITSS